MLSKLIFRCAIAVAASAALSSFAPPSVQEALSIPFFAVLTAAWAISLSCIGLASNFCLAEPLEQSFRAKVASEVNSIRRSNTALFATAAVVFAVRCAFPDAAFALQPISFSLESLAACTSAVAAFCVFKSFHRLFAIKMEASKRIFEVECARRSQEILDRIEPR